MLFSGGKFTWVLIKGADHHSDFYQHNHLSELKVFAGDRRQKRDKELVGQAGGQTLLCLQLRYFFPHMTNDS